MASSNGQTKNSAVSCGQKFDSVPDDSVVIPSKREGSEISRCARNDMRTQRISTQTFMSNILLAQESFE
jgi:hypothetical protein